MEKGIVTRNDSKWQGHPDVAYFRNRFYVVFRQSDKHKTVGDTEIILVTSYDGIHYDKPICLAATPNRFNCPRLKIIGNKLWLICDQVLRNEDFIGAENEAQNTAIYLWWTEDGKEWSEGIRTNITGIVPDRICETDDGGFLIGTHTSSKSEDHEASEYLIQNVWKTDNLGGEWEKHSIANIPWYNLCEASICNTGQGMLVCLMRENSQRGDPALWSFSVDSGQTWNAPLKTRLFGCHRPVLGKLSNGLYLTTYREQMNAHSPPFWGKNTFACLTTEKSVVHQKKPFVNSIVLPLDHDNSRFSDGGYTGWVEAKGYIYVVNYTVKNAPNPHIVWYRIHENEF